MTQEEFENARIDIEAEYFRQLQGIERQRIQTLNVQGVEPGDIIETEEGIMKVADIGYYHALPGKKDFLRFRGKEYNRNLKRTRDMNFHDVFWHEGLHLKIIRKRTKYGHRS